MSPPEGAGDSKQCKGRRTTEIVSRCTVGLEGERHDGWK